MRVENLNYSGTISLHCIQKVHIRKAHVLAFRLVKKWLGLTQLITTAELHHPAVLDIPFLDKFSGKAELTDLSAAVICSRDPFKEEITSLSLLLHTNSALGSSEVTANV